MPWSFPARVIDVHDGDTIKVEADLGFKIRLEVNVRLLNVYAPELAEKPDPATGNPGGAATRQCVVDWMLTRTPVPAHPFPLTVATTRLPGSPDTFDRYVADVTDLDGASLNDAVRAFLGGKQYGRGTHPSNP
jgi:endonuclease YncB( thermonuclease family)